MPKSSKASLWCGPTTADLGSAHGSWAPEVWGTWVDHPLSPGCRTGTDHKCLIGCPQILGSHACTPRAAPLGLGDSVAPSHALEGCRIMVSLVTQPGRPFAIFLHCQASKFVSKCWTYCWALSWRALSVGCSSLEDDFSDSLEGVSSLGLGWH